MSTLADSLPTTPNEFHHAYLVRGSAEGLSDMVESVFGVARSGHPDLYWYDQEKVDITTAREIHAQQSRKPLSAPATVFVVETDEITSEAQNALLKVCEDPAPSSVFFICVPPTARIIETLSSRMQVIEVTSAQTQSISSDAFLSALPAQRMALINEIITAKDRGALASFTSKLERHIVELWRTRGEDEQLRTALEEIRMIYPYIGDGGSSPKLLAEHIAVTMPVITSEQAS